MKKLAFIYAAFSLPLLTLAGCDDMKVQHPLNRSASDTQEITATDIEDSALEQYITTALLRDPLFRNGHVTVTSHRGQVTLHGTVTTQEHIVKAEDITRRIQGVTAVINSLSLKSANTQI